MICNAVTRWVARRLERRMRRIMDARNPDFIIGATEDPYLRRWWVIPRNPFINVYLHDFRKDDIDRALHDHPFASVSLALSDAPLVEIYAKRERDREMTTLLPAYRWFEARRVIRQGCLVYRQGKFAHRMGVPREPALTLFLTGPRFREWGFWCPKGWVPYREFVDARDHGKVGRGCGE